MKVKCDQSGRLDNWEEWRQKLSWVDTNDIVNRMEHSSHLPQPVGAHRSTTKDNFILVTARTWNFIFDF